jgi:adenine-specific DNA glycosylase
VGRKTANVVLNCAFGMETFAVDTHIFRVGNRTGLAKGKTPEAVEKAAGEEGARAVSRGGASLADPARALYLQGADAGVLAVSGGGSVRVQG